MNQPEKDTLRSGEARETTGADEPEDGFVSDQQLLGEYAARQSEGAFAQIVARHARFVYSAALRQTGNETTAEEITQAVFVILARKASLLRRETVLEGWLFRAVRYAAMDARKIEQRRNRRELEAARMHSTDAGEEPESTWTQMAPLIDEALASLSAKDSHAILLRFFEEKSFRHIGEMLGGNENSARLRVVRALEKLRGFFQKRGIVLSSGLLSSALLVNSSQAAPPALAGSVMGMVASGHCPAAVAQFIHAILRRIWWRTLSLWAGSMAVAAFFLAAVLMALVREDRVQIATQVRAAVVVIDNAISFDDPDAFIAHVHFRNSEEEQFKPVFAAFIRATVGLRKQVRETFAAQPVRMRIWLWMVEQLFSGQPRQGQSSISAHRVTDDFFQPHLLVMVKVEDVWKWDFFASLPPHFARERMRTLREKTALCKRVTRRIQNGEITTAEQVLAVIQEDPN
jgi:RNA polymerase sigma factor (sigma-70 family)